MKNIQKRVYIKSDVIIIKSFDEGWDIIWTLTQPRMKGPQTMPKSKDDFEEVMKLSVIMVSVKLTGVFSLC